MSDRYEIVIYWSESDGCFLAEVPEIPKLITDGATRAEAVAATEEMISSYLATAREGGGARRLLLSRPAGIRP